MNVSEKKLKQEENKTLICGIVRFICNEVSVVGGALHIVMYNGKLRNKDLDSCLKCLPDHWSLEQCPEDVKQKYVRSIVWFVSLMKDLSMAQRKKLYINNWSFNLDGAKKLDNDSIND